jgi:hypothetical protein
MRPRRHLTLIDLMAAVVAAALGMGFLTLSPHPRLPAVFVIFWLIVPLGSGDTIPNSVALPPHRPPTSRKPDDYHARNHERRLPKPDLGEASIVSCRTCPC